jgi:hypothetical protein
VISAEVVDGSGVATQFAGYPPASSLIMSGATPGVFTYTLMLTNTTGAQTYGASSPATLSVTVPTCTGGCGSASGTTTTTAPTSNLCAAGWTASLVAGSGPWTWTCTLGTVIDSCSASPPSSSYYCYCNGGESWLNQCTTSPSTLSNCPYTGSPGYSGLGWNCTACPTSCADPGGCS